MKSRKPLTRERRRREMTTSTILALTVVLLGPLLTSTAAPASAAEPALLIASAKEMAGVPRTAELVRIPVVLTEADGILSADELVVHEGATAPGAAPIGAVLTSQATDVDLFAGGEVRGVNLYVSDDFEADEERFYTITRTDSPVASPLPAVTVTETATTLSVAGADTGLTFAKSGTANPGTISAISSALIPVALTAAGAGPQASLRFTDILSRGINDDFESVAGSVPADWSSHVRVGSPVFAHASDRFRSGSRSVSISASGSVAQSGLWASTRLPATPGARYLLEGALTTTAVAADPASSFSGARIGVRFYDASGAFVQEVYSTPGTGAKWTPTATPTITAPASAATMSLITRLDGTGTVWFDQLTLARADAATAPISGTSATQSTVGLTAETGPLFAQVTVVNQQKRSGALAGGFQIARYLVPQHGDHFTQETEYRGALGPADHGVEALSVVPFRGKVALGSDGATGDALTAVSLAVGGPSLNPADTEAALVDSASSAAFLAVGSSIDTIRRVDYTGGELRVVGGDFHTGIANYDMQIRGEQQRHLLRYAFADDVSAEGLRTVNAAAANPVVGIVDRADASFDDDLVPLIKQAADLLLEVPATTRSWSSGALAAYVNGEITGDASYTATGDALTNAWLTPQRQTVAYWESLFDAGHDVLDADLSSLYYIAYFNDDDRLWQTAHAAGVGLKNSLDFVDAAGNHQIQTLAPGTSITNMVLSGGPSYLWGARRAGDTVTADYWTTMFSQPAMTRYVNAVEMPYETVKDSTYRPAGELVSPLYVAADASYFRNLEIVSQGELEYPNRASRAGYTAIDIDHEGYGENSTGWIDQDRLHPTFVQRWKFSNHYPISLKSVLDEATDARTGVTSGARWLQRFLDVAARPVSDERGIHQLPIYIDPEISDEFNRRNWGDTLPPGNEVNNGSGLGSLVRHLLDAYMVREHAAEID